MNPFHAYLSESIEEKLRARRVVVLYDPKQEFADFIKELSGGSDAELSDVAVHGLPAKLARFTGSFFALRLLVEPLVAVDQPGPLLLYVGGAAHDVRSSVLAELELGGTTYEPQLKRLARNVLREKFSDGQIDEMLAPESLTYRDIVGLMQQTGAGAAPSMLNVVFEGTSDNAALLARWMAEEESDRALQEKGALPELLKLLQHRAGLALDETTAPVEARKWAVRYVLVNEFRDDLSGEPPVAVAMVPKPTAKAQTEFVRKIADALRAKHAVRYTVLADSVEAELGLRTADVEADRLGSVDTFRFEEQALLTHCDRLIHAGKYDEALKLVKERSPCFWVKEDLNRQAQWQVCQFLAELGQHIGAIQTDLKTMGTAAEAWVEAYTERWHRADTTHRLLEAWIAKMGLDPECEKALAVVRQDFEEMLEKQARGFAAALESSGWTIPGALAQTQVFQESVKPSAGPVAYFLVDAMRYEMGRELAAYLADTEELRVRPAMSVLPSITPLGMAALLPGASASYSVVAHGDKLAALMDGTTLPDLTARLKYLKARTPGVIEITLGKLLQATSGKLAAEIAGAPLVVIRSQEIDALGEAGDDWTARQIMDTVISNLARAIRKLAAAGMERFVIAADHGHQFSVRKEEDMRMESPGGATVDLHRRCWAGHGGTTPPGTVRIRGAELGYQTDLDFVFPKGIAVFRTGGGLTYHHGGFSLQELVIPVISLRIPAKQKKAAALRQVVVEQLPVTLTNRTFGLKITVNGDLFASGPVSVRVLLLSNGEQVGQAGMAVDAEFDRKSGVLKLTPGTTASVGVMLTRDDCSTIKVAVVDAETDVVLEQSRDIPVKLGL